MHGHSRVTTDPRPLYTAGMERLWFSPTRKALLAPSAEPREVFGELHEGFHALLRAACEENLLAYGWQRRIN